MKSALFDFLTNGFEISISSGFTDACDELGSMFKAIIIISGFIKFIANKDPSPSGSFGIGGGDNSVPGDGSGVMIGSERPPFSGCNTPLEVQHYSHYSHYISLILALILILAFFWFLLGFIRLIGFIRKHPWYLIIIMILSFMSGVYTEQVGLHTSEDIYDSVDGAIYNLNHIIHMLSTNGFYNATVINIFTNVMDIKSKTEDLIFGFVNNLTAWYVIVNMGVIIFLIGWYVGGHTNIEDTILTRAWVEGWNGVLQSIMAALIITRVSHWLPYQFILLCWAPLLPMLMNLQRRYGSPFAWDMLHSDNNWILLGLKNLKRYLVNNYQALFISSVLLIFVIFSAFVGIVNFSIYVVIGLTMILTWLVKLLFDHYWNRNISR